MCCHVIKKLRFRARSDHQVADPLKVIWGIVFRVALATWIRVIQRVRGKGKKGKGNTTATTGLYIWW